MDIKQNQCQDDGLPPQLHAPTWRVFLLQRLIQSKQIDADFTDLTVSEAFISVGNTSKVNSSIV